MTRGEVPARSERSSTWSPAMWCGGSARSQLPGPPNRSYVAAADARSALAGSRAPFGSPVEPEVKTTRAVGSTGSSSAAVSGSGAGPARRGSSGATGRRAGPDPASARSRSGRTDSASGPGGTGSSRTARPLTRVRVWAMAQASSDRLGSGALRWALPPRDPGEEHRASTPLELLFDLCFVVAVGQAAARLHHSVGEAHVGHGLLGYVTVFFAIWWAWMNFSWFASAYDQDDVLYRLLTLVQMSGVLVLATGVDAAFEKQ